MSVKFKTVIFASILPFITAIFGLFAKRYDIALNSAYTLLSVVAFWLIIKRIPALKTGTFCAVIIFILLSVFAGRTLSAYSLVPYWDKILHFLSGFIAVAAGRQIYTYLKGDIKNKALMNLFALFLAIAVAAVWEIYEFAGDTLLGLSSQNGSLPDTMWDIIAGTASAVLSVIFF